MTLCPPRSSGLSRMHENPLPAGRVKDRNHFARHLLRENRGRGRSYAQPRPRHLRPRPGQLRGPRQQHRQGQEVTLILTSRTRSSYGSIDIRPGSTIEVTAPAFGAAAGIPGIAIWVDGHAQATSDRLDGGRTQNINGAIYQPGRQVKYSRGSLSTTRCSQLIAHAVTFTGNSYFRHDCAGVGLSDPDPPSLLAE